MRTHLQTFCPFSASKTLHQFPIAASHISLLLWLYRPLWVFLYEQCDIHPFWGFFFAWTMWYVSVSSFFVLFCSHMNNVMYLCNVLFFCIFSLHERCDIPLHDPFFCFVHVWIMWHSAESSILLSFFLCEHFYTSFWYMSIHVSPPFCAFFPVWTLLYLFL